MLEIQSPEIRQVFGDTGLNIKTYMQVQNWTGPGVRRSQRAILENSICCKCYIETY